MKNHLPKREKGAPQDALFQEAFKPLIARVRAT